MFDFAYQPSPIKFPIDALKMKSWCFPVGFPKNTEKGITTSPLRFQQDNCWVKGSLKISGIWMNPAQYIPIFVDLNPHAVAQTQQ